jgi:hypothetical protein
MSINLNFKGLYYECVNDLRVFIIYIKLISLLTTSYCSYKLSIEMQTLSREFIQLYLHRGIKCGILNRCSVLTTGFCGYINEEQKYKIFSKQSWTTFICITETAAVSKEQFPATVNNTKYFYQYLFSLLKSYNIIQSHYMKCTDHV